MRLTTRVGLLACVLLFAACRDEVPQPPRQPAEPTVVAPRASDAPAPRDDSPATDSPDTATAVADPPILALGTSVELPVPELVTVPRAPGALALHRRVEDGRTQLSIGDRAYDAGGRVTDLGVSPNGTVVVETTGGLVFVGDGEVLGRRPVADPPVLYPGSRTTIEVSGRRAIVRRRAGAIATISPVGEMREATLSPDGMTLAWTETDGTVGVASLADPTRRWTWAGAASTARAVQLVLTGDDRLYVLAERKRRIEVFDTARGAQLTDLVVDRPLYAIADGGEVGLLLADAHGDVIALRVDDGSYVARPLLRAAAATPVDLMRTAPTLDRLVTCSRNGFRLWRLSDLTLIAESDAACNAVTLDSELELLYVDRGAEVLALGLHTGRPVAPIDSVALGARSVVARTANELLAWPRDADTVALSLSLGPRDHTALEPDAEHVVLARVGEPVVRLEMPAGNPVDLELEHPPSSVSSMAVSGDGAHLVALHDAGLSVWQLSDGRRTHRIELTGRELDACDQDCRVIVSDDGGHVAWVSSGRAVVVRVSDGERVELQRDAVERLVWLGAAHLGVAAAGISVYDIASPDAPIWSRADDGATLLGPTGSDGEVAIRNEGVVELVERHTGLVRAVVAQPADAPTSWTAVRAGHLIATGTALLTLRPLDDIERMTEFIEQGAPLFGTPAPKPAPLPVSMLRGDPVAVRASLGLPEDRSPDGRVVDASRGLRLELASQPGRVLLDLESLPTGDVACLAPPTHPPDHVLVFDGAGTSMALTFDEVSVDLWLVESEQGCRRSVTVFAEPDGELLFETTLRVWQDGAGRWHVPPIQRIGLELTPAHHGLEQLLIGEHGLRISASDDALFTLLDDSGEWIYRDREDYEGRADPYEDIPTLSVELLREPAGTLLLDVTFESNNDGPHGSGTKRTRQLVRLSLDDDGALDDTLLVEESSESSSGWTFDGDTRRASRSIEATLEGPDGAAVEYAWRRESSSETWHCEADHAADDCCESTTTSAESSTRWSHSELGLLYEPPSVDEEETTGDCD